MARYRLVFVPRPRGISLEPILKRRLVQSYVTAPVYWAPSLLISAMLAWILVDAVDEAPIKSLVGIFIAFLVGFGAVACAAFWKLVGDHGTWWVLGDEQAGAVLLATYRGQDSVNVDLHAAWPKRALAYGNIGYGGLLRQGFARQMHACGRVVTAKATFCLIRKYERDGMHRLHWVISGARMTSVPKSLGPKHVALVSVSLLGAEGPTWACTVDEFCHHYRFHLDTEPRAVLDWARVAGLAVTFHR